MLQRLHKSLCCDWCVLAGHSLDLSHSVDLSHSAMSHYAAPLLCLQDSHAVGDFCLQACTVHQYSAPVSAVLTHCIYCSRATLLARHAAHTPLYMQGTAWT